MPNVELHFFAANDLNGATILEITSDDTYFEGVQLDMSLDDLGEGRFMLSRQVGFAIFDSGAFQPETFVRVLIPAISETQYVWGFFLSSRVQKVISAQEKGGEQFVFGGPGPAFYLDRAILWDEQFAGDGWNIDRENGVFRFNGTSNAGRVLRFLTLDNDANTIADFLPALTRTFDETDDSNGDPWTDDLSNDDFFELQIGQSFLQDAWQVADAVTQLDYTWDMGTVATPKFEWSAWQAYGRDLTAASVSDFASDVVHLKEAVNIINDLTATGTSFRKVSHALVRGADGAWGRATRSTYDPGEYAKAYMIDYSKTPNENVLERAGLRFLRHQDEGEREISVLFDVGFVPTTGKYFPGEAGTSGHVWLGDAISLTTGNGTWTPLDYRNEEQRVTGINMGLRPAADDSTATKAAWSWRCQLILNRERGSDSTPSRGQTRPGSAGCNCLKLCESNAAGFVDIALEEGDSADQPVNIQVVETGLYMLSFLANVAAPASATEWWEDNAGVSGTPQSLTLVRRVDDHATDHHDIEAWELYDPDESVHAASGVIHNTADSRFAYAVLLYRGPTASTSDDGDTGTGTDPSITVATAAGEVVVAALSYHDHGPSEASTTISHAAGQTSRGGEVSGGTHSQGISVAEKVATGASTTLSWTLGTSRPWSIVAVVLPPLGDEGPADIGTYGISGVDGRAARCDHVHGHGLLSTSGTHYHDTDQIEGIGDSIAAHLADTVDAHDASAVSFVPAGTIAATNVQTAIEEAASEGDNAAHLADASDAHDASAISFVPTGTIAATDVQAAIAEAASEAAHSHYAAIDVVIGDGTNVISTGVKGFVRIPFACTIVRASLAADASGSIVIDVWKDTHANFPPTVADTITAAAKPTLASAQKYEDATLTGWSLTCAEGSWFAFNVDSATTVKQVTLELKVLKT